MLVRTLTPASLQALIASSVAGVSSEELLSSVPSTSRHTWQLSCSAEYTPAKL